MRILVVVPHADDEAICMGGTIAKLSRSNEVTLAVGGVGWGDPLVRIVELMHSCGILNIDNLDILCPDDKESYLDTVPQSDLIGRLDKILLGDYNQVYYPCPGHHHQDHRAVHDACHAALRRSMIPFLAMYEYAYPGWLEFSQVFGKLYVDIGDTIEDKLAAIACYQSQNLSSVGARRLASARGLESGCEYAEMFYIAREIR